PPPVTPPPVTPPPVFSITDVIVTEGTQPGQNQAVFTIALSEPSDVPENVIAQTTDGTAIAFEDYSPLAPTIVRFEPGETTKQIGINIVPDSLAELDEFFFMDLEPDPNGRAIAPDPQGQATIKDDDPPGVFVSDVVVGEGMFPGQNQAVFTMELSRQSTLVENIVVQTTDGTAIAGQDYTPLGPTTIRFEPGETIKTISVPIAGDSIVELDETLFLNVSADPNGRAIVIDPQGEATIKNDDSAQIIVTPPSPTPEGDSEIMPVNFTVALTNPVDVPVACNFNAADGTAPTNNATAADNDYQPTSGIVQFNALETSPKAIPVNIVGDTQIETDETFILNFFGLQNNGREVSWNTNQFTGTILNDDVVPKVSLSVDREAIAETGEQAIVTASLDMPASQDVDVSLGFDGEATLDADHTVSTQTIRIPAGELSGTTTLTSVDDLIDEMDGEGVDVSIVAVANAMEDGEQQVSVFIEDNDAAGITPTETDGNTAVAECGEGDAYLQFHDRHNGLR
ncbi:MAG: hypothetical protein F6K65_36385, partial [Moorea sp. SIO3C2]|nr:hypothetical protein [Moorena sp. SIO3C2]